MRRGSCWSRTRRKGSRPVSTAGPWGPFGHLAAISFHATKNVVAGEGGALLINDPELVERAEIILEKGTNRRQFHRGEIDKYTWVGLGSSYAASELVAAFLRAQLELSMAEQKGTTVAV